MAYSISFEGETVAQLTPDFHHAIDFYIADCGEHFQLMTACHQLAALNIEKLLNSNRRQIDDGSPHFNFSSPSWQTCAVTVIG